MTLTHSRVSEYAARAAVHGTGLLSALPAAAARRVLAGAEMRYAVAGERIFSSGDPADALWICACGAVRLSRRSGNGRRRILRYVGEGGWFDPAGFVLGTQQCEADARTYAILLVLRRAEVQRMLAASPEFGRGLLQDLAEQVGSLGAALADDGALPLDALLAKTLAGLLRQHGRPLQPEGEATRVDLPLTQTELGELIGYSRQRVNAALKRLERRGVVSLHGGTIVVDDARSLSAAAGEDAQYERTLSCSRASRTSRLGEPNSKDLPARSPSPTPRALEDAPDR